MKIVKKHAVAIAQMFALFLDDGYYALTPEEGEFLGRVHGFGIHHDILPADLEDYKGKNSIAKPPAKAKRARLQMEDCDAESVISIYDEMQNSATLEESLDFMGSTIRYLRKTFNAEEE